jgi:hypothetical protein
MDDLAADVDGIETTVNSISSQATAIKAKTDNLPAAPAATGDAMALTTGERTSLIAALFASISEGTETFIQSFRLMRAGAAGKLSGAATTSVKLRNAADTKDRIAATVDADGNRTAVTTDGT